MRSFQNIKTLYSILYIIYMLYLLYQYLKEKYILLPIYNEFISTEKIDDVERAFLSNDTGVTIFDAPTGTRFENCLFVFNSCHGNSNLKYILMRQLQETFDKFTIVQIEYPGYGFCSHFPISITEILNTVAETYEILIKKHCDIQCMGFFGEQFGTYVQSFVYNYAQKHNLQRPDFIMELNGISNIFDFAMREYNFFLYPVQLPLLQWKSKEYDSICSTTPFFILYTDDTKHNLESLSFFYQMSQKSEHTQLIFLQGKKSFGFLLHENQEKIDGIYHFVENHCNKKSSSNRIVSNSPP